MARVRFGVCWVCVARVLFFVGFGVCWVRVFARCHAFLLQFGSAFCWVRDIRSLLFGSEFVGCECHDEFVLWFGSEVCGCE